MKIILILLFLSSVILVESEEESSKKIRCNHYPNFAPPVPPYGFGHYAGGYVPKPLGHQYVHKPPGLQYVHKPPALQYVQKPPYNQYVHEPSRYDYVSEHSTGFNQDLAEKHKPFDPTGFNQDLPEKHKPFDPTVYCENPCKCDPVIVPVAHTKIIEQEVQQDIVLDCDKDSYFTRIEYHGCFSLKTSCNAVVGGCEGPIDGFYLGYLRKPHGSEQPIYLNAKDYCSWFSFLNGNLQNKEKTTITGKQCNGDILSSLSQWLSEEPLTGCCTHGVRKLTAVDFELKIYGQCCSRCTLRNATLVYPKRVSNKP